MNPKTQKGAATLIYLALITLIAVLILTVSYSRMLLALKRGQSMSDTIIANYSAESKINDFLAIIFGGYRDFDDFSFPIKYTLGGTTIEVDGEKSGNTETLFVTASRYLAVSKLKATRVASSETLSNNVEIFLSLDCTPSMSEPADPDDDIPPIPTRMQKQKEAVLAFLDSIIADSQNRDRYKIGINTFQYEADWLELNDVEVRPDSTLTLEQVRQAVQQGFGTRQGNSSACIGDGATSIGSGLAHMNTYYRDNPPPPRTKRVEILISDGEPNSRIPYDRCPDPDAGSVYCPYSGGNTCGKGNDHEWPCYSTSLNTCKPLAFKFVRCTLADTNTVWNTQSNYKGDRNPDIDAYVITVLAGLDSGSQIVQILNQYATQYFNTDNANELPALLSDILETVSGGLSTVTIEKIVPE